MATAQDASNDGWVRDAWDFVDNGLSRANDVLKTYINWDQYQTNKDTAEVKQGFLRDYGAFLSDVPRSTRPGAVNGGQFAPGVQPSSAGSWQRTGSGAGGMMGMSPAMLAVLGVGAVLLLRR